MAESVCSHRQSRTQGQRPTYLRRSASLPECIREKKNIAFRYSYRWPDGVVDSFPTTRGEELFDEMPIELVYSFGYYCHYFRGRQGTRME